MDYEARPFYAILIAICYLSTIMAALAWQKAYTEALGFGGIVVGLIGVIRQPQRHSVTIDNKPSDPVPTQDAAS